MSYISHTFNVRIACRSNFLPGSHTGVQHSVNTYLSGAAKATMQHPTAAGLASLPVCVSSASCNPPAILSNINKQAHGSGALHWSIKPDRTARDRFRKATLLLQQFYRIPKKMHSEIRPCHLVMNCMDLTPQQNKGWFHFGIKHNRSLKFCIFYILKWAELYQCCCIITMHVMNEPGLCVISQDEPY